SARPALPRQSGRLVSIGKCSHSHNLISAVHVDHLSGDGGGAVAGKEDAGRAKFIGEHVAFERRVSFVVLDHFRETGDAARGQGVHWPGADAVYADFFRSKVVSEVARTRFER